MKIIIELLLLVILLLIGALTAASETAIIAASIIKLRRLAADGSKPAKIILKILETPERFFGTILVANNIVDALIASIVTVMIVSFSGSNSRSILLATIVASFLIIIFEVAAKTLSAKKPVRIALYLSMTVKYLIIILSPVVRILSTITNFVVNLLGGGTKGKPSLVVEDEIKALIRIGEEESPKHKDKYKMLTKVFEFSDTVVKTVMIPKDRMILIDICANIEDILDKVLESGYSRLPVYKDNPDNIIGVINMKDLLNLSVNRDLVILQDIIYPPIFVPDSKNVAELLKEFQKGHTHLAIIIDSYGKIQGLVTMEDLLEEIVGEIEDEHDIRKKIRK
ncbi:MAG: hemolysin family protein [Candidatus Omnitrophica bacterium]|nr:hemolysin family protein [Candidatus Omnitrophota bacterium]